MDILGMGTASLDLLFMTPEERTAHDVNRMLKKLINYILDHLDDKQSPPSMQDLRNEPFARGFQAGYREAYRQWSKEGEERLDEAYDAGIRDERKQWIAKQMNIKPCSTPTQTPTTTSKTAVQTNPAPERWCAAQQTEPPNDEGPTSLENAQTAHRVDFGTQTTSKTNDITIQTENECEPAPTAPVTRLDASIDAATSPLSTAAQPPSTSTTSLTTPTTAPSPAPKLPPAPQKQRHTLLSRPTAPQPRPQPRPPCPERPIAVTTSQPPPPTLPAATASETASRAPSSIQTAPPTTETHPPAVNAAPTPSTALETPLCEVVRTRSSERIVYSTKPPRQLQRRSRSPPTPPSSPQLAPVTPVSHHRPTTMPHASTQPATSSSTTAASPALPHPGPPSTALKRRHTLPEPSEHPQVLSHLPCSPQNTQKRTVSPPPAFYNPAMSPTTPSKPVDAPRPLSTPPSPPIHPSSTQLDRKRAVSPPPARFDWAEDAASLPTAPSTSLRDILCLKTGCSQPFVTLRRRTRRRRAPPRIFSSRKIFHSAMPSLISLISSQPFITRCHPSGIGPGKPIVIVPFRGAPAPAPPAPVLNLDWGSNPRLVDLSRALQALGWTPPC
jgi:hypothetical protein